jgi:hypothetical protein
MGADTLVGPVRAESPLLALATDQPRRLFSPAVSDLIARASIGALFTLLSINIFADYVRTGHITGLLLLVGESLVVVLTILRRRTNIVDRSAAAAIMTTMSLAGPALLRATDGHASFRRIAAWSCGARTRSCGIPSTRDISSRTCRSSPLIRRPGIFP